MVIAGTAFRFQLLTAQWDVCLGALLLLGAHAASTWGWLSHQSRAHSGLNVLGSALVARSAFHAGQPLLALLEGAWACLSLHALVTRPGAAAAVEQEVVR